MDNVEEKNTKVTHFIEQIIEEDLLSGKVQQIHTRFPPEPNGFLHIGHAKSICLNFGIAEKYKGLCNLRFDDTNPSKENTEFVESIIEDIHWLGFDWGSRLFFASDYFDKFYECAVNLIKKELAYVCDLNTEEIRHYRGTLTAPGKDSPYRNRSISENLELFDRMKSGEFHDGQKVLRAKINMNSPNLNMRDPVIYRILHASHHRTKDQWCIYPMYDYAHPLSDAVENITHSLCTLEFEDHRPLYNWFIEHVGLEHEPRQIEFARLNISKTVLSKRMLRKMVEDSQVDGWDDPRMPTISGLRKRGYTPSSVRHFCDLIGVAKSNSIVEKELLEYCIREDLNKNAPRIMAVLNPLKVIITNFPASEIEWMEAENNPEDPLAGKRMLPFTRELYIEREDFMEEPPKKFFRLAPGKEVRLKNAYIIQCNEVIKDKSTGEIVELHCTFDSMTKSSQDTSGKKVKGTLHWISVSHVSPIEVRFYGDLLIAPDNSIDHKIESLPNEFQFNPQSLKEVKQGFIEKNIEKSFNTMHFQFLRHGYFTLDQSFQQKERILFHHIVSLKDTWAKLQKNSKTE